MTLRPVRSAIRIAAAAVLVLGVSACSDDGAEVRNLTEETGGAGESGAPTTGSGPGSTGSTGSTGSAATTGSTGSAGSTGTVATPTP